jgi:hypothetical protein
MDCIVLNEKIACEPYAKMSTAGAAVTAANGRAGAVSSPGGQGTVLVPLRILFSCTDPLRARPEGPIIRPGDIAWVRAEDRAQPWAKAVKRQGSEQEFILVPLRNVEMVERVYDAPGA